jgi:hypothetical protein
MATGTIARRRFSLGPLTMAAAIAGIIGVALTLAVATTMFLNPTGDVPIADPARWVDWQQRHLELEYGRPAANPQQWVLQQEHLEREYGR